MIILNPLQACSAFKSPIRYWRQRYRWQESIQFNFRDEFERNNCIGSDYEVIGFASVSASFGAVLQQADNKYSSW
jgi:hypothetical protein